MLSKESFLIAYQAMDKEQEVNEEFERLLQMIVYHPQNVLLEYCPPSQRALMDILRKEMEDEAGWIDEWDLEHIVYWYDEEGNFHREEMPDPADFYDFLMSSKSKTFNPREENRLEDEEYEEFINSKEFLLSQAEGLLNAYNSMMSEILGDKTQQSDDGREE